MSEGADDRQIGTVIIGVGNEFRGDDAVGLVVARQLRTTSSIHATILEQSGEGAALLEAMAGANRLIVIDASESGAFPGTIHKLEVATRPVPAAFFHHSTHAFGVVEAIEMARALGQLPPQVTVFAIEGRRFDYGTTMSDEVVSAAEQVADIIRLQLCAPG